MCSLSPPRGALLAGLLAVATHASASGLQIAPTGLQIVPGGPAQALWLTNTGDHELHAQVRAFRLVAVDRSRRARTDAGPAREPADVEHSAGRTTARSCHPHRTGRLSGRRAGVSAPRRRAAAGRIEGDRACSTCCAIRCRCSSVRRARHRHCSGRPTSAAQASSSTSTTPARFTRKSLHSICRNRGRTGRTRAGLARLRVAGATMHWTVALPAGANAANASIKALINGEPTDQTLSPGVPSR